MTETSTIQNESPPIIDQEPEDHRKSLELKHGYKISNNTWKYYPKFQTNKYPFTFEQLAYNEFTKIKEKKKLGVWID